MEMQMNPLNNSFSDTELTFEKPETVNNLFHTWAGFGIHIVNKLKHELKGYTSARGFSSSEFDRAISHDFRIVKRWVDYLKEYNGLEVQLENKSVLELGPGADLGVGLICLAEGAEQYFAMDVHNLVQGAPEELYDRFFEIMKTYDYSDKQLGALKAQYQLWQNNQPQQLQYRCQKDFDLSVFEGKGIDLVVSNSAFQQFDDPFKTCKQLDKIVKSGGQFVALIDLKTHTRWIKERDPLNIYRYSNSLYKGLKFKGIQNRMRPNEFKKALEQSNWKDVKIFPRLKLDHNYVNQVIPSLHSKFRQEESDMDCLTVVICATKK